MSGGRDLKGINVSIGGDTTKLQSALAGVNKEVKNTIKTNVTIVVSGIKTVVTTVWTLM